MFLTYQFANEMTEEGECFYPIGDIEIEGFPEGYEISYSYEYIGDTDTLSEAIEIAHKRLEKAIEENKLTN